MDYVMTIYRTCKDGHVCLDIANENLVLSHMLALQLTQMQLTFEKLTNFGRNFLPGIFEGIFCNFQSNFNIV